MMFNKTKKRKKGGDGSPVVIKKSNLNAASATDCRSIRSDSKWNAPSVSESGHECSSQLAHAAAKQEHHRRGIATANDGVVDQTVLLAERQRTAAIAPTAALTLLQQQHQQQQQHGLEGLLAPSAPLWPLLYDQNHQQQPIGLWQRSPRLWLHHSAQQRLFNMYWSQAIANGVAASAATANNIFAQQQENNHREEILQRLASIRPPAFVAMGGQTMMPVSVVSSLVPPNFMSSPGSATTASAVMGRDASISFPTTALPPLSSRSRSHYHNNEKCSRNNTTKDPLHVAATADSTSEVPPRNLPAILALPGDSQRLSPRQVFLRHQIEAFEATEDDVMTYTRGRNKRIKLGQVGIRCRHCAHVPVADKQKGAVYFPATLLGLYQAGQNMSTIHLQCGLCTHTPDHVKRTFITLMETTGVGLGAGRAYWMQAGKKLGLVDTEDEGIRFSPPITTTESPLAVGPERASDK